MTRAKLPLLILSVFCLAASTAVAQKNPATETPDDEKTVKKAPTNAEILASRLTFSKEITRVTDLKTEDGLPDYEAAVNRHFGKGVKPEENGAVLLYEALGPSPEGSPMDERFFELMGVKRPPLDGDYFTHIAADLPLERRQEVNSGEFSIAMTRPWTEKECPEVARWLRMNEKHVAKVIEAASRPKYYSPLVVPKDEKGRPQGLVASLLPGVQNSRSIGRYLICRALLNIQKGNADAAWSDQMACHRLGCMIAKGPTLIESLVGIAMNSMAASVDIIFLDQIEMDAAQLARCRRDLRSLPPMPDMIEQLDWCERMLYLDCVLLIGVGRTDTLDLLGARIPSPREGALEAILTRILVASVDWNTVMRTGNRMYDRLIVAMKRKTYLQREASLEVIDGLVKQSKQNVSFAGFLKAVGETGSSSAAMSEMAANMMVALLLPAVRAVNTAHARSIQTRHHLDVAFALAEWKLKNDSYPDSLDELVPRYLESAPLDSFNGKPLQYRREGDGFLIYSVGQNGEDEGGRWYDDEPRGDDPRVRLPIPQEEYQQNDP